MSFAPARVLILLPLALLTAACGTVKEKREDKPRATGEMKLVGTVELVNPEQNYVLIRCDQQQQIAAGTELVAIDPTGARSTLSLSAERKGLYLTADIKSGNPSAKSLVMLPQGVMRVQAPSAAPARPATPSTGGLDFGTPLPGAFAPQLGAPAAPTGPTIPLDPLAPSPPGQGLDAGAPPTLPQR